MSYAHGGAAAEATGDDPDPADPRRIVIVDDDIDVREFVRLTIELDDRFRLVGHGASGEEAIGLLTGLRPELALVDLRMPDVGGMELLRAARQAAPDCKVVVFTGSSDAHTASVLRRAGAAGVIVKGATTPRAMTDELFAIAANDETIDLREEA